MKLGPEALKTYIRKYCYQLMVDDELFASDVMTLAEMAHEEHRRRSKESMRKDFQKRLNNIYTDAVKISNRMRGL